MNSSKSSIVTSFGDVKLWLFLSGMTRCFAKLKFIWTGL